MILYTRRMIYRNPSSKSVEAELTYDRRLGACPQPFLVPSWPPPSTPTMGDVPYSEMGSTKLPGHRITFRHKTLHHS
jgi:hypothetical protein